MWSAILRFISGALSVYMLLLFVRILLSWFSGPMREGRAIQILYSVTNPYLNWFRRFSFLRAGRIDFSPIAAIITLVIVLNITNTLAVTGKISIGIILALAVSAVGSAAFFIIGLLLLITVIRTVSAFVASSSVHPIWQTLDSIIAPIHSFIHKTFFKNREFTYQIGLALSSVVLAATYFIGRFLLRWLVDLLSRIPF